MCALPRTEKFVIDKTIMNTLNPQCFVDNDGINIFLDNDGINIFIENDGINIFVDDDGINTFIDLTTK